VTAGNCSPVSEPEVPFLFSESLLQAFFCFGEVAVLCELRGSEADLYA